MVRASSSCATAGIRDSKAARWNTTRALAVPRFRGGRKVPPFLQRRRADDLLAAVFPDQVGCQENITGPLQFPDHPLIRQTKDDCLREAMDIDGLLRVLDQVAAQLILQHYLDHHATA